MQRYCQNCRRDVSITITTGQELVCPVCGTVLPRVDVGKTVDWTFGASRGEVIDGTVDLRTYPQDAASLRDEGDTKQKPLPPEDSLPTAGRAPWTIDATLDHVEGKTLSVAELKRREKKLDQFEEIWKLGGTPAIAEFLGDSENCDGLLVELVHLDLSYRLKTGQDAQVEQYLEQFPELKQDRHAMLELILAEFRSRGRQGMNPTQESFTKRFPEFTDELAVLLKQPPRSRRRRFPIRLNCPHCHNAIAVVDSEDNHEVVCPSCQSSFRIDVDLTQSWTPEALPMVGRFQLVRMLGRGAFGTVYQAKDTTLNRLVALKIPRSGTFSSRDDEDRFVSEAEHAAQLNHAGIVQVYDVGRTDEYPYIVTELVPGVTLSDVLTARRIGFAEAARLVATIADALQHAHEHQVIHRDLKPANIMIDVDENPRVMDFGLAKRQASEITVALDGSILGTPAYMSPEQASGQSQSADRRSDVYSLGVILFELLSGERPFRGNSVMLLRQVVHTEAPKLRHLNDKIPLDLETIAAKCLEKDREKRYQTAKELADDLRRHLNHEPIHARPLGRIERAGRWCKRNPLLVKSAATVFATLVIALCVVSVFWRSESIQRRRAGELADANRALYELEQVAKQEAVVAKEHALQRLRDAREATDLWLTVFPQRLEELPGASQVREKFLLQAAQDYERFAQQQSGDPNLELERGRSWLRLGDVRRMLPQDEAAFEAYEQAAEVFTEIEPTTDLVAEVATELATAWVGTGLVLKHLGRDEEATKHMERSIATLSEQLRDHPNYRQLQEVLADARINLSDLQERSGDIARSQATVSLAVTDCTAICDRWPEPRNRLRLASAESMQGKLLADSGEYEAACLVVQRAIGNLDELVALDAESVEYRFARAENRILLASVLRSLGDTEAELIAYDEALADYTLCDQQRAGVPAIREQLAMCLFDHANLLQHLQRSREAELLLREVFPISNDLASAYGRPEHYEQVAAVSAMLGEVYRDLGRYDESEQHLRSAVNIYEQLTEQYENVGYVAGLAITRSQLGQTLVALDQTEAATNELRAAASAFDSILELAPDTPRYLNEAAYTNWHLGETIMPASPEESNTAFARAVALWDRLASTTPSPEHLNSFAWFCVTCADAKWQDGARAVRLAERAVKLQPSNTLYRTTLGGAHYRQSDFKSCESMLSALEREGHATGAVQFFLAMSLAKQKQMADASQHYDAGTAWLLEHQPGNRLLLRLQQEALSIVEVADPDDSSAVGR